MLKKILHHLLKGNLLGAIRYKLDVKKWNRFTEGKVVVPYTFDNDIQLKLYTDSKFSRIINSNTFEEEELTFFRNFIRPNDTVLDIGANIGLHALFAAKLVGENGMVCAFEPVHKTYNRLSENVAANRFTNIRVFNQAISSKTGTSVITTSLDGFDAWNSMAGRSHETGENFVDEEIKTQTLDDFIAEHLTEKKIDFIKIDTEGWEPHVLRGGSKFLSENSPLIMIEYADGICKNFGVSLNEIYDLLTGFGFTILKYNHLNNSFRHVRREEKFTEANVIATKNPASFLN